jgi:hypothetical protein
MLIPLKFDVSYYCGACKGQAEIPSSRETSKLLL